MDPKSLTPLNSSEVAYLVNLDSGRNVAASYAQRALGMLARGEPMPGEPPKAAPPKAAPPPRARALPSPKDEATEEKGAAEGD